MCKKRFTCTFAGLLRRICVTQWLKSTGLLHFRSHHVW